MKISRNGPEHTVGAPNCTGYVAEDRIRWPQQHRSVKLQHQVNCDGYMHCEKTWDSKGNYIGLKRKCDRCGSET